MSARPRLFRVFVSSTFGDLTAERNALQERVFPNLVRFCREHGVNFQAVDLRWGVSEEAALDQQTMTICLEEVRRCRAVSPRLNFLVLLGDRYGWRPLPAQVEAEEFEQLLRALPEPDRSRLRRWYHRDDNAVPAEYVLVGREGEFADSQRWADEEAALRGSFLQAVESVLPAHDPRRLKYEASATHQEIAHGVLAQEDRGPVHCYFRELDGLPQGANGKGFVDLSPDDTLDEDARRRLTELKSQLIEKLPAACIHPIRAPWPGCLAGSELEAFCERVEGDLRSSILAVLEETKETTELAAEVEAHREFGAGRARQFVGRRDVLDRIGAYLNEDHLAPLIIHGRSGAGKTAILARAAEECLRREEMRVIIRFIGATPRSSDLASLLEDLCREIYDLLDLETEKQERLTRVRQKEWLASDEVRAIEAEYAIPRTVPELTKTFADFLDRVSTRLSGRGRLVLFLDALDQLRPTDNAHSLRWLPSVPLDVSLVATVLEDDGPAGKCHRAAAARYLDTQLVPVPVLAPEEAEQLFGAWLSGASRRLRAEQRQAVLGRFARCPLPLYLKLAFEESRRWKSEDGIPPLNDDVPGILADLFTRLEDGANHGRNFVRRAMASLAASRHGLSEHELLAVLSADPDVVAEHRRRSPHSPDSKSLPPILWSRLYFDLAPYLAERTADGAAVLSFYHRQVEAAVVRRYLEGEERTKAHRLLANYFSRMVEAPVGGKPGTPDPRKTDELPCQLTLSKSWNDLTALLTDLEFLESKCLAGQASDLVEDYRRALELGPLEASWPGRARVTSFARFVRNRADVLNRFPSLLLQEAANQPATEDVSRLARLLLDRRPGQPWLWWTNRPERSDPCVAVLSGHEGDVRACHCSPDGRWIASVAGWGASPNHEVLIWDAETGEQLAKITPYGSRLPLAWEPSGSVLVTGSGDLGLEMWDGPSGVKLGEVDTFGSGQDLQLQFGSDGRELAVLFSSGALVVFDLATRLSRLRWEAQSDPVTAFRYSADGQRLVTATRGGVVRVCSTGDGALLLEWKGGSGDVHPWAFSADGRRVAGRFTDTIRTMDVQSGHWFPPIPQQPGSLGMIRLSPDGDWLLAETLTPASGKGVMTAVLDLWEVKTGKLQATLSRGERALPDWQWSPDGRRILVCAGAALKVFDAGSGNLLAEHPGPEQGIVCCACAARGGRVVTGHADRTLRLWDAALIDSPNPPPAHRQPILDCSWFPDGGVVVSASADNSLTLWYATAGNSRRWQSLTGQAKDRGLTTCDCSPDGGRVVAGTEASGTLLLWDGESGFPMETVVDESKAKIRRCRFSPDGRRLATAGDQGVRLWDTADWALLNAGHPVGGHTCTWSPDGKLLLVSHQEGGNPAAARLFYLDGADGSFLRYLPSHGLALGWFPDGRRLLAARGNHANVLDARSGALVAAFTGHRDEVLAGAVSPDNVLTATGGKDRTLHVWDSRTGDLVATFVADREITSIAFCGDGESLAVGDAGGDLYLLRLCGRAPSPLLATVRRSWRFGQASTGWIVLGGMLSGGWEEDLQVRCGRCGTRFLPPAEAVARIRALSNYYAADDLSPRPFPAWCSADEELRGTCPACGTTLQFTPFLVDEAADWPTDPPREGGAKERPFKRLERGRVYARVPNWPGIPLLAGFCVILFGLSWWLTSWWWGWFLAVPFTLLAGFLAWRGLLVLGGWLILSSCPRCGRAVSLWYTHRPQCLHCGCVHYPHLVRDGSRRAGGRRETVGRRAEVALAFQEFQEALLLSQEQERLCREADDWEGVQQSLGRQAHLHAAQERWEEALDLAGQQERLCREKGLDGGLRYSLLLQAQVLDEQGRKDEAFKRCEDAESICRPWNDDIGFYAALYGRSLILEDRGDYTGALALAEEQEKVARRLGDLALLGACIVTKALLLGKMDREEERRACIEEANRLVSTHNLAGVRELIQQRLLQVVPAPNPEGGT